MSLGARMPTIVIAAVPAGGDIRLSADRMATAAGISTTTLTRLVRAGLIEPVAPGGTEFTVAMAARLRRMLRLRADLRVNLIGAAIILDLVERLDHLHAKSEGRH